MIMRQRYITSGLDWGRIDLLLSLFIIFLAVAALSIIMVPKANENLNSGRMLVQLYWDNTIDADVDLWVQGPEDHPVGYMSRTGSVFDLLHDHRGYKVEGDYSNTEFAIARHLPEGQYTINAVLYASWDAKYPIPVKVVVQLLGKGPPVTIFEGKTQLTIEKQELTMVNFRLDGAGHIIEGSFNNLQKMLWRQ